MRWTLPSLAAAAFLACGTAQGAELAFTAALRGDRMPTMTGSKATGAAAILVDTDHQTVDMTLDVVGLTIEDLRKSLVPSPMGPIHLHVYGSHDHSNPDSAQLLFPAPFGANYAATPTGFRVVMKQFPYAKGASLVNSSAKFDDFVASLRGGTVVLNIHTNAQPDGEISGDVLPVGS